AVEAKPDFLQYWISYILILIELRQSEDAGKALLEARKKGLDDPSFQELNSRISGASNSEEKPESSKGIENVLELYNQGKLDESLKAGEKILPENPHSFELLNVIGVVSAKLNRLENAAEYIEKALSLKPEFIDGYNNLGNIYQQGKRFDQAIESYKKGITLDPLSANLHNNLGCVMKEIGRMDSAIQAFQKAIELRPEHAEAFNNMGLAYKISGDLEAAIQNYSEAIRLKKDFAEPHNNLGVVYQEKGELPAAINSFEKAIALVPNHGEALVNMGVALQSIGKLNESILFFEKAIAEKKQAQNKKDKARSFLLKSLFTLGKKERLLEELGSLLSSGEKHAMIGSFCSRAKSKYGLQVKNPFCEYPLNYVVKTTLSKSCDFENLFRKPALSVLQGSEVSNKYQSLLINAEQTSGNILAGGSYFSDEARSEIHQAIENYRRQFESSEEGLIKSWPDKYEISGWLVRYKNGGSVSPHIHEAGWLSGSIYINVPQSIGLDDGNLFVSLDEREYQRTENADSGMVVDVQTGVLCLFPASLHHCTIPFNSSEDRIVLAFDVIPK
ncbi:MAG: hypothetical protein CL926_03145, partial [Deltaproteobacteria bacterium]|nr:hypothetical protein [Deltaproteobacteria bacterium]